MSATISIETMESELKTAQDKLKSVYEELTTLEQKIAQQDSQMKALGYELKMLDQEKPVDYYPEGKASEFRKSVEFNKLVVGGTVLVCALGGGLLGLLKPDQLSPWWMSSLGGVAGFTVNYLRSYLSPVFFDYQDIPFKAVQATYEHGYLQELEHQKERGRYQSRFFGNPFYYSEAKLAFQVEKRMIPMNAERIQVIRSEMQALNLVKEALEKEQAQKTAEKEQLLSQVVTLESRFKRAKVLREAKTEGESAATALSGLSSSSPVFSLSLSESSLRNRGSMAARPLPAEGYDPGLGVLKP